MIAKTNNKSKFANNLVQIEKPERLNQKNIGELLKRLEDLNIISSINNAINEGESLKEIIQLFSKETKKLFSSLGATVYLLSEDSKYLLMQNSTLPPGIVKKVENIIRIKIPEIKILLKKESAYSRALKQTKPQLINNPEDIEKLIYDFAETVKLKNRILHKTFKKITPKIHKLLNINSVLIVPLISNCKAIGVIDISREKPFRNNDLERFKVISGIITTAIYKKLSEDRLKSSIIESNMILETGIDGMRVIDKDFNVLRVNKQFCIISGLTRSKNLAKKCYESFPGEHCNKPTCTVKRLLSGSSRAEREAEKVRTDSKVFPCIITALPLKDADGKVISMVENYKDITERKKAEDSIRKSEEKYRTIVKNVNDSIFIHDFKGKIIDINENSLKLLGYNKRDELMKTNIADFHIKESVNLIKERMNILKKRKSMAFDVDFINKNKEIIPVSVSTKLISEKGNGIIQSFVRDISEKKNTEIMLKTEKETAQKYLDIAGVMIVVIDKGGRVSLINKKGCEILGYRKDDIIGKNWFDNFVPKKIKSEVKKVAIKILSGEVQLVEYYENQVLTRDGKERIISWHNSILNDDNGKIIAMLSSGNDITDIKKAEEEIKNSYQKLQKTLNDTIDTLASIVETKDPYTSGHQKRVAALAVPIAKELGLGKDEIEATSTAAMIHDIGKINIPASILARPGKISDIEYSMIKTHPQVGYDMIKRIEFPWSIADIVLQHHEKLDGSGYPNGLKGKDIVLEARILAVADVVEAMSSHRPYRPALGIDKALKEIKKGRGKLYDRKVVEACVKIITKKGFKF